MVDNKNFDGTFWCGELTFGFPSLKSLELVILSTGVTGAVWDGYLAFVDETVGTAVVDEPPWIEDLLDLVDLVVEEDGVEEPAGSILILIALFLDDNDEESGLVFAAELVTNHSLSVYRSRSIQGVCTEADIILGFSNSS